MLVLGAVVILALGMVAGFLIERGRDDQGAVLMETRTQLGLLQKALAQSEDRNWTYFRANQALESELADLRAGSSTVSTAVAGLQSVFSDGVYLVGEDIQPGMYDGVVEAEVGYWARLSDVDGSTHAIIANGIPRGPFVLAITPGDKAVELRGVQIVLR